MGSLSTLFGGDKLCVKAALPANCDSSEGTSGGVNRRWQESGSGGGLGSTPVLGEYTREWSHGVSLDATNFDQNFALASFRTESSRNHRPLEIAFVSRPAPGRLGQLGVKIAYFFPRLVVVNLLERPIAVTQAESKSWRTRARFSNSSASGRESTVAVGEGTDSAAIPSIQPRERVVDLAPREWRAVQLPFARAKRQLGLDLGSEFKPSAKFWLDQIGEHALLVKRREAVKLVDDHDDDSTNRGRTRDYSLNFPFSRTSGLSAFAVATPRFPTAGSPRPVVAGNPSAARTMGGELGVCPIPELGLWFAPDKEADCIIVQRVTRSLHPSLIQVKIGDQVLF